MHREAAAEREVPVEAIVQRVEAAAETIVVDFLFAFEGAEAIAIIYAHIKMSSIHEITLLPGLYTLHIMHGIKDLLLTAYNGMDTKEEQPS